MAITKRRSAIFKQGRWDRRAKPHWRCSCRLSITSSGRLPLWTMPSFPTHDCSNLTNWHLTNLTSLHLLITYALTIVQTASSVCHRGKPLVVEQVNHKRFLTLPKVCQGDSIKRRQKVFGKTKHFARYVLSSMLDGDSSCRHTGWRFLFGQSHPPRMGNCYTRHILSFHSKPVNSNSSAKVVSPFKRQE